MSLSVIEIVFGLWLRSGIFQHLTDLERVEATLPYRET